ncbi:MAG: ferredoxin [Pseudomonadota bacterium]
MRALSDVEAAAAGEGLAVMGALHPESPGGIAPDARTLVLLGPDGPRWEAVFAAAPEAADGQPHPIDRWSRRVVGALAQSLGGDALFPFEGPPWLPVISWAVASGWAWPSPVGMLVHARAGLWFSCRGVLALPDRLDLPTRPDAAPCLACEGRPCESACPVSAFASGTYDVPACATYLSGEGAASCLAQGCAVRHACPVGAAWRPVPQQAARHMEAFLRGNAPSGGTKAVDKPVDKSKSA